MQQPELPCTPEEAEALGARDPQASSLVPGQRDKRVVVWGWAARKSAPSPAAH